MPTVTIGENSDNTYSGVDDTRLLEASPTSNYFGSSTFEAKKEAAANWSTSLIRFTGLSNISGPVTVSAASLFVRCSDNGGVSGASQGLSAHRVLHAWVVNQATWSIYSTGNNWGTAGGLQDGVDRIATPIGTLEAIGEAGAYKEIALDPSVVQGWINGDIDNEGVLLERSGGENDGFYMIFNSSEGTDGQRPYLSVTYEEGSASTTVEPIRGAVTLQGAQPSVNPFSSVRIQEVLINEAGSPLGNMSNMSLLVWYAGAPIGAPDLSYSDVTTDNAGTMSYNLAVGTLAYNQPIFYVATDGNGSLSAWTCARMTPTYS